MNRIANFGSSEEELKNFFANSGVVGFEASQLTISGYPFEPSAAFNNPVIPATSIGYACVTVRPYIRYGEELIIFSAMEKQNLLQFAERNKIPLVEHDWIWDLLLEPFLDTEQTPEDKIKIEQRLAGYGLSASDTQKIRAEVAHQMLKYNFDTMLWDWVNLSLYDVLCAMRVKYNKEEFRDFYKRAMKIALLSENKPAPEK